MPRSRYDDLTDEALCSLFQSEEKEPTFTALYTRYAHRIYLYALAVTGSREIAEDILQETFTRFFQIATGPSIIEKVSNYLFVVARNLSINARERSRKVVGLEDLDLQTVQPDPDRSNLAAMIGLALELLDTAHREVFVLRLVDGMEYAEIARITGASEATLRKRFERAKLRLRRALAPVYSELRQT